MSLKQLYDLLIQSWQNEPEGIIDWHGDEENQQKGAWSVIETYARETPIPPDEKPEGVEVAAEAEIDPGLPVLRGILDLVRANRIIVDFKTTSKTPNYGMVIHTTEIQLTSYALLYREATGSRESGLELHHLVKGKSPKLVVSQIPSIAESQKLRLLRIIESYASGLERHDIIPSAGMHCASCEFITECRGWYWRSR